MAGQQPENVDDLFRALDDYRAVGPLTRPDFEKWWASQPPAMRTALDQIVSEFPKWISASD
jgi:hypothetical protein